ncbi:Beta-ketoadipate enol-lactone hydrolase [Rhodovulum sp. P5]|uniref:alpha/beta fold hydrolase n=1 Tax=Rhodovulum sp. P5 TaxID=1564506 RepID=UPI0009C3C89E|nr:alpha/beta hydrolase [Rhodovulum sp. P5]ARE40626.1 Beta-ketoadipate enol-lactone hydrolase [Rhodovulum sp. P5]
MSPADVGDTGGRSEERPLVLVHGYLGGAGQWADLRQAFSNRFRVVTIDLPGFSDAAHRPAPATIGGFADDVIAQLDALGIDRFCLLGHSMGGMIVQEMAHKIPSRVDRLVLYGTGPLGRMPDRFETLEVSLERLDCEGVAATARRIAATWFVKGEDHPGFQIVNRIGAMASAAAAQSSLQAMADWDGRPNLSSLTMPSLVVWGDRDKSYRWPQVETLWSGLPDASLAVVPGASHAVHLEKPDIFTAIVMDYLTSR